MSETTAFIEEIPEIFYREDFDLTNPDVFGQVIGLGDDDIVKSKESLARYLDTIESGLVKEVASKADAFFSALTTVGDLQGQLSDILCAVEELKRQLQSVNVILSTPRERMTALMKELEQLCETHRLLRLAAELNRAQPTIQYLLDQCSFEPALKLINGALEIYEEFRDMSLFEPLGIELTEMKVALEKMQHATASELS